MAKIINGGYSVKIGDYTLELLGGYSPTWTNEYDENNSFADYLGNKQRILKGRRFSLKISVGRLDSVDYNALVTALKSETIALVCPDFSGDCYCESIPAELKQANFNGVRYAISFTLTAKNLINDEDGL